MTDDDRRRDDKDETTRSCGTPPETSWLSQGENDGEAEKEVKRYHRDDRDESDKKNPEVEKIEPKILADPRPLSNSLRHSLTLCEGFPDHDVARFNSN